MYSKIDYFCTSLWGFMLLMMMMMRRRRRRRRRLFES
jgi:hypothetical protein